MPYDGLAHLGSGRTVFEGGRIRKIVRKRGEGRIGITVETKERTLLIRVEGRADKKTRRRIGLCFRTGPKKARERE